jgi:hypothetical protein
LHQALGGFRSSETALSVLFMPGNFEILYVLVDNTTVKTTDDHAERVCIGNSVRNEESSLESLLATSYEA